MNYDLQLKYILEQKKGKWWLEYPPLPYIPVSMARVKVYLHNVFSSKNKHGIGLYIHIPFCVSRCFFCGFYSVPVSDKDIMAKYVDCLEKELFSYGINFNQHSLRSIYIGGGTPTLLDEDSWNKIFKIVNKFFKIDKGAQIATEGTPETCTYSKLKLLKGLGVNRFSIGAQTFDDKILNSLNRRHSVSDIYTAFENARKVNFKYLNADLLFGLPGETKVTFLKTLQSIVKLKPDCISPTFFEFNSYVCFNEKDVRESYISKDKSEVDAFIQLSKFLASFGYRNVIDGINYRCFFLDGNIQSYNKTVVPVITRDSIFAIGCNAESYLNYSGDILYQLRSIKYLGPQEYISRLMNDKEVIFSGREITEDEIIRQYLIYCFVYLMGRINKKYFLSTFRKEPILFLKDNFSRLLKDNEFTETQKHIFFYRKWPYSFTNRKDFVIFCLKYLYSKKMLKNIEKKFSLFSRFKQRLFS